MLKPGKSQENLSELVTLDPQSVRFPVFLPCCMPEKADLYRLPSHLAPFPLSLQGSANERHQQSRRWEVRKVRVFISVPYHLPAKMAPVQLPCLMALRSCSNCSTPSPCTLTPKGGDSFLMILIPRCFTGLYCSHQPAHTPLNSP